jgi:hypothetical protein
MYIIQNADLRTLKAPKPNSIARMKEPTMAKPRIPGGPISPGSFQTIHKPHRNQSETKVSASAPSSFGSILATPSTSWSLNGNANLNQWPPFYPLAPGATREASAWRPQYGNQ